MRDTAWIEGLTIIRVTDGGGVLVDNGKDQIWITRAAIIDHTDEIVGGALIDIEITQQLAEDKGLV